MVLPIPISFSGDSHSGGCLEDYADSDSKRHQDMVNLISRKLRFDSLKLKTGRLACRHEVDSCKLCTYCWNGKE